MNCKLLLPVLLNAVASTAYGVIDLTPTASEYEAQGFKYLQLVFRDDKRTIIYEPPQKWDHRGQKSQLQLTPPDKKFAEALIQAIPLKAVEPLDPAGFIKFKEYVLAGLPSGSQLITTVAEGENTLLVNGAPSFELVVSYQTLGETFHRSVLLTNCNDTQLLFRLTARKSDFGTLYQAFKRSIMSWTVTEQPPANLNRSQ